MSDSVAERQTEKVKPRLRGVSHFLGFFAAMGGVAFLAMAPAHGAQWAAGVVYGVSLCCTLGISALYHRPNWSHAGRARLRRVDHAGIFGLIAGTSTPFAVIGAQGHWSLMLSATWAAAIIGMVVAVVFTHAHRGLRAAIYVGIGLCSAPVLIGLHRYIGVERVVALLAGAAIYITGAAVYARRWPNPRPAVFGYHEVFHVFVLVAAAIHFGVVLDVQYRQQ